MAKGQKLSVGAPQKQIRHKTIEGRDYQVHGDCILQRFRKFKTLFVSANIPSGQLLEIIEDYLTSDIGIDDSLAVERILSLDGQVSLFDYEMGAIA